MTYVYVSYKHPKHRKLEYVTFSTMEDADKAPKEIIGRHGTYLQYGIHIADDKWREVMCT